MPTQPYEQLLSKLGFSDKEAKVYLASLEIGPAPVQQIAQKATVKRATCYVMIESLKDRGLMSSFTKGKKVFFTAESPSRINSLLEDEKNSVDAKRKILSDVLPNLLAFAAEKNGERPRVSFFEGIEGVRSIHEDVLKTTDKTLENIVSLDDAGKFSSPSDDVVTFRDKLLKKGTVIRVLYTSKNNKLDLPKEIREKWQFKQISEEKFPLHGELTLYGDKVAAFSFRGKIFGTIIESREIANTVRALFELAWINA